jgi:hypothetical protein
MPPIPVITENRPALVAARRHLVPSPGTLDS